MTTSPSRENVGSLAGGGAEHEHARAGTTVLAALRRLARPGISLPVVVAIVFLAGWEVYGRLSNPILFSPPTRVVSAFAHIASTGALWTMLMQTLNTLIVGWVLSVVIGIGLGILLGRRSTLSRVLEPYLDAIYATPRVVIIPLVIVWFGTGYAGRLFVVWIGTVIPIAINTAIGVRNARRDLVEVATSFGASERQLVRHVIIPGSVPYILAGLRIGAGRALLGVVIAEMFLNQTGVGGFIDTQGAFFHTAPMLAGVLVFSILGVLMMGSLTWVENRFSAWKGHSDT